MWARLVVPALRVSRVRRTVHTAQPTDTRTRGTALPLHAVVKWQRKATREATGSGFLLANEHGVQLVTNAHVVADARYVAVRKARAATTYRARVLALSHESDLALLGVDDARFWAEDASAGLRLGALPHLQDHVSVLGFPTGGEGVSVTRGVVSRIEPIQYAHGAIHLLGVQIDASINAGNSGGPALLESGAGGGGEAEQGSVVGVAFQALLGADNIGYIIPAPVITHFLTQYHTHKRYSGFPQMGLQYQTLENATQRRALGLRAEQSGVLVTRIAPVSPAHAVVRSGDVITHIDAQPIANNGSVAFRDGERLYLNALLVHKFVGDVCAMTLVREGTETHVAFPLASSAQLALVPVHVPAPSYLVYGGLVFTRLTLPYLQEFSGGAQGDDGGDGAGAWYDHAPRALVHRATTALRSDAHEEVVILSHVLPDDLNAGYTHLANLELRHVNGTRITSMRALHHALHRAPAPDAYTRFGFVDEIALVLDAAEVVRRNREILDYYAVPAAHSPDLA